MPPHTPKRVRTGCLKCRVRRRKCDEGKPRCQRCITGGFECRYGTRVSFLDKNVITARSERSSRSQSPTYRTVQFITEPIGQSSHSETERQVSTTPSPHIAQPTRESPAAPSSEIPTALEHTARTAHPSASPHYEHVWPTGFSPADGYEAALDALISLGEDRSGPLTQRSQAPGVRGSLGGHRLPHIETIDIHASPGNHRNNVSDASDLDRVTHELGLSKSGVLGLLRYYRYEVAPWLDICDLGQTFGNLVSCLTAVSTPVLLSVVNLASSLSKETAQEGNGNANGRTLASSSSAAPQPLQADLSTRLLCQVLCESRWILSGELGASSCQGIDHFAEISSPPPLSFATHPIDIATYYLILRFDLSYSLASGQPPSLPLWPPDEFPFSIQGSDIAALVFRSATDILVLCARAATLAFGGHDAHGESRVERWSCLLDFVCAWYTNRFQTFRPMVEVDGKGDDFPLVLFTSGAALMANQLYHTAMLLLLQNKPRTFKASRAKVSSTMSALWHARMICGIALGNDARECWDPSLVASFVLAARGMTHWDQQRRLLDKLDGIGRLTGWKVANYRKLMMEEWGM